ncbi:hypothetical protein ACP70R_000258 [Stipagrostis hirtigluma subsp. patula]
MPGSPASIGTHGSSAAEDPVPDDCAISKRHPLHLPMPLLQSLRSQTVGGHRCAAQGFTAEGVRSRRDWRTRTADGGDGAQLVSECVATEGYSSISLMEFPIGDSGEEDLIL